MRTWVRQAGRQEETKELLCVCLVTEAEAEMQGRERVGGMGMGWSG
jgi:hypothetical protein